MKTQLLIVSVALVLAALAAVSIGAQYPVQAPNTIEGITVSGTGELRAKPNLVEIDLRTSGTAELSGDALVKYRDTKRRMIEAFQGLKLKNLGIGERGMTLTGAMDAAKMQQAMRFGQAPPDDKTQLQISRTLHLTLRDVQDMPDEDLMETLGKLYDVAKDAGSSLAPSPEAAQIARNYGREVSGAAFMFVLDNITELREKAYQQAVKDARERAQRLASLTGVKLSGILGVQEIQVSGDDPTVQPQPYYYYYG